MEYKQKMDYIKLRISKGSSGRPLKPIEPSSYYGADAGRRCYRLQFSTISINIFAIFMPKQVGLMRYYF